MVDTEEGQKKREKREHFKSSDTLVLPEGILGVHLKQIKSLKLDGDKLVEGPSINVFLRLMLGHLKKTTRHNQINTDCKQIALDEVKLFVLTISNRRHDANNQLSIQLVSIEKGKEKVIAQKNIHLYDFIKKLYTVETHRLGRKDKASVAEVDMEFIFHYGIMGYGFSNQFENRQVDPSAQIQHSLFYRAQAPPHRRQQGDIMTATAVGHPSYIPFDTKTTIGWTMANIGSDISLIRKEEKEPILVKSEINKRLNALKTKYNKISELGSRKDRIKFLELLVHKEGTGVEEALNIKIKDDDKEEDESSEIDQQSETKIMSRILEMAPGIVQRKIQLSGETYMYQAPSTSRNADMVDVSSTEEAQKPTEDVVKTTKDSFNFIGTAMKLLRWKKKVVPEKQDAPSVSLTIAPTQESDTE